MDMPILPQQIIFESPLQTESGEKEYEKEIHKGKMNTKSSSKRNVGYPMKDYKRLKKREEKFSQQVQEDFL